MEVAWKDAEVDCCAGRLNLCTFISATRCTKVCSHYTDRGEAWQVAVMDMS